MLRKKLLIVISVVILSGLAGSGCQGVQFVEYVTPTPIAEEPTPTEEFLNLSDFAIDSRFLMSDSERQQCTSERPENIGCTTLCKPCITWICVEGEWEQLELDTDDLCNRPDSSDPGPFACPRNDVGFCPAECSICF